MLWILDTSAWARRDVPEVKQRLEALASNPDAEVVLSPAVLLELLRGPQGEAVADAHEEFKRTFRVLDVNAETFTLAAQAMTELALTGADAHRLPVTDLVTSALAHQQRAGVLHIDGDYDAISIGSSFKFATERVLDPEDTPKSLPHPVAGVQRTLKRELYQLLHQRPVADAEEFLRQAVAQVKTDIDAAG